MDFVIFGSCLTQIVWNHLIKFNDNFLLILISKNIDSPKKKKKKKKSKNSDKLVYTLEI